MIEIKIDDETYTEEEYKKDFLRYFRTETGKRKISTFREENCAKEENCANFPCAVCALYIIEEDSYSFTQCQRNLFNSFKGIKEIHDWAKKHPDVTNRDKKKEETKRSKDADISIDVDALKKSIEVNGHTSKSIVAMEELAELSQAVSKAYRYIDNNETKMESGLNTADILDNMAEEIADVLICIANLKIMYGIKNEDINGWIDYKIRRQKIKDTKMKSK